VGDGCERRDAVSWGFGGKQRGVSLEEDCHGQAAVRAEGLLEASCWWRHAALQGTRQTVLGGGLLQGAR
jgi:hypothetical protein